MVPFTLRIGPAVYDVMVEENLQAAGGDKIDGQIMHGAELMQIEESLPRRTQRVTVVHEILHGILQQAGKYKFYKNEGLLDALAYGLVGAQVNPGAVMGPEVSLLTPLFEAMEGKAPCPTD